MASAQPSKVWIGRTGASAEEGLGGAVGSEGLVPVGEHEEDSLTAASRRASRQQAMRQRGSGAVSLPSLVLA